MDETKEMMETDVAGLDQDFGDQTVALVATDDDGTEHTFKVKRNIAVISGMIRRALDADPTATSILIPKLIDDSLEGNTKSHVPLHELVGYAVEFMVHHNGTDAKIPECPLKSKIMTEVLEDPWDASFINKIASNKWALYDLLILANLLEIKGLLHIGAAKVASFIIGKDLSTIQQILDPNVSCDPEADATEAPRATEATEATKATEATVDTKPYY